MANPQLEDGYTRLANELTEALYRTKLNGTQFRIVLAVIRHTYGFNRKEHEMSDNFIAEATQINARQVKRELKKLIEDNVLIVTDEGTRSEPRKIMINKNYKKWKEEKSSKEIENVDKKPSAPPVKPPKEENHGGIASAIADYYSTLLGKQVFGQEVTIFNFVKDLEEKDRDINLIKLAMLKAKENWKPRYQGDQIRTFNYFVPAIREAIALKDAKEKGKGGSGDGRNSGYDSESKKSNKKQYGTIV